MKRKYRIKATLREEIESWLNIIQCVDVPPIYTVYAVQMRIFPFIWVTIKEFDDYCDWVAHSRALNLIDELNKDTL